MLSMSYRNYVCQNDSFTEILTAMREKPEHQELIQQGCDALLGKLTDDPEKGSPLVLEEAIVELLLNVMDLHRSNAKIVCRLLQKLPFLWLLALFQVCLKS
jgi:hypothetical protein